MEYAPLSLPVANLSISNSEGSYYVFDVIRKKKVKLTHEEWVRQHFIHFLISYLHYPKGLIGVEKGLKYLKKYKRCDIMVFDRDTSIFMVIECKAPDVNISQITFEQLASYCYSLQSKYAVVTNGLQHYCYKIDFGNNTYQFLSQLPSFRASI
jgi:hypothetical protein